MAVINEKHLDWRTMFLILSKNTTSRKGATCSGNNLQNSDIPSIPGYLLFFRCLILNNHCSDDGFITRVGICSLLKKQQDRQTFLFFSIHPPGHTGHNPHQEFSSVIQPEHMSSTLRWLLWHVQLWKKST
jgi:hypothetical protein